jgi:hypothetical protein
MRRQHGAGRRNAADTRLAYCGAMTIHATARLRAPALTVLALAVGLPLGSLPSQADELLGTYGRWQLEKAELPGGSASFHTLRSLEARGEPSRLALSCSGGKRFPYFSHAQMEKMTGDEATPVTLSADGREEVATVLHPVGNLGLLGDLQQHESLVALIRSADDSVTVKVRGRTFVFAAGGLRAGAAEMERRCPAQTAKLR